jgi:MFS family permease
VISPAPRTAEKRALLLSFVAFGSFWGALAALLPDLRAQAGVDDGQLGLAMGAVALSALPAMPLAGRLMDRSGAARLLPLSLVAFAAVTPLVGFATSLPALVAAFVGLGAATGVFDVALNTATAAWERVEGDRLMAAGHGCFSLGVVVGSVTTGVARELGATPAGVLPAVALLLAGAACVQPAYRRAPAETTAPGRRRLGPVLLLLGGLIGLAFLAEDGLQSWSALHLERTLDASPSVGGLGAGMFAGAMAVGRLGAHALVPPGRDVLVVALGGVGIGVGSLVLAFAPTAAVGLVGLVVAGLGTSVLAPTLFSAVGARSAPGRQGSDLAAVTALGYAGFITGPPLVGVVSSATSLPTALALFGVVGAVLAVAGPAVLRRPVAAAPAPPSYV